MNGIFIGQTALDLHYFVTRLPKSNEVVESKDLEINVGGPATNAAIAFKYLGGFPFLFSPLGDTPFSEYAIEKLNTFGVNHINIENSDSYVPTISTIISTSNGERTILTHNKPAENFIESLNLLLNMTDTDLCLTDFLNTEFALEVFKKKSFLHVIHDAERFDESFERIAKYITILICSESFFKVNSKSVLKTFLVNHPNICAIAVTRGDNSILAIEGSTYFEIPIRQIEVFDTLGAGDIFHGAFCFYYGKTQNFQFSLIEASIIATKSCEFKGAHGWMNKI